MHILLQGYITLFFIKNLLLFCLRIYIRIVLEVITLGIESLKSKVQKRLQQEELKKDYQEVGTFIKKRRKDLNMTQDMISNGICSVSYLSKIENNQIAPNAFFIKEIMNKLEIEEDFVKKNLEDQSYLQKTIQGIFYSDEESVKSMYDDIVDVDDNVTIDICKFGYMTVFEKKMSGESMMRLEAMIMNMSNLELKTYLLFSSLYFIAYDDYKTALEVLSLGLSIKGGNDYIQALINEEMYYVKQRLLKKNSSLQHYDEAMRIYRKYFNNDRIMILTLRMIDYLSIEHPIVGYEKINQLNEGLLSERTSAFFYFLKGKLSFFLERYQESVGYLSHIPEGSEYHIDKLILLYEICLIEDDMDMLEELKLIISDYKMKRSDLRSKVYYHYLNERTEEDLKVYLRDVAIPFSIKSCNYQMLKFYTDRIMEICINNSRYKEATQYYKKCNKEIERVNCLL